MLAVHTCIAVPCQLIAFPQSRCFFPTMQLLALHTAYHSHSPLLLSSCQETKCRCVLSTYLCTSSLLRVLGDITEQALLFHHVTGAFKVSVELMCLCQRLCCPLPVRGWTQLLWWSVFQILTASKWLAYLEGLLHLSEGLEMDPF